jgi:hypothetical protein
MLQNKLDVFTNSTLIMCVKARSFANSLVLKLACHLEKLNANPLKSTKDNLLVSIIPIFS